MFKDNQKTGREQGPRPRIDRRSGRWSLETLETRQLMAYSAFGYSLPQLAVTGYSAPVAAYGGTLAIDINVENRGASSLVEPTNLYPGAISSADALGTTVQIYGSATPNGRSGYVLLGSVATPVIRQNSDFETVANVVLPKRAAGFPANKFYLTLVVNNDRSVIQANNSGNVFHIATPVKIVRDSLPDLQVVAVDIPAPLQPGDVVAPTIRIENFGVGDPAAQGGVTVAVVASLDKTFGAGDAVVATFVIPSLPGISGVPTQSAIGIDNNLLPAPNVFTTTLPAFRLPTTPGFYYLGVKIDPVNQINQTYGPNAKLSNVIPVGPADRFLPAATVLATGATPVFPALPVTAVNLGGLGQVPIVTPLATTVSVASVHPISAKQARAKAHHHR